MEASCQFYIAGAKLGFSTFDSLLLHLSWLEARAHTKRALEQWAHLSAASVGKAVTARDCAGRGYSTHRIGSSVQEVQGTESDLAMTNSTSRIL